MPSPVNSDGSIEAGVILDAWRARGDDRVDPVRFRFIEALTRRTVAHQGDTRRILDDKVRKLMQAYGQAVDASAQVTNEAIACRVAAPQARSARGPLAELVDYIARPASSHGIDPAGEDAAASHHVPPSEMKTLGYFRSTWSKLSADRRMTQSLATVPENAGPLNSHHLVHRSLALMRDLAPEYLSRFMSHVDTLLWLDKANGGQALARADIPRLEGQRKSGRGKAGR